MSLMETNKTLSYQQSVVEDGHAKAQANHQAAQPYQKCVYFVKRASTLKTQIPVKHFQSVCNLELTKPSENWLQNGKIRIFWQ